MSAGAAGAAGAERGGAAASAAGAAGTGRGGAGAGGAGRGPQGSRGSGRKGSGRNAGRGGSRGGRAGRAAGKRAVFAGQADATRLSEDIEHSVRMKLFLESSVLDLVLVLLVSTALTFTISYGFESAAGYRGNVLLIMAITLPILVALFWGTWSKKMVVPSAVVTAVIAVIVVGIAVGVSPEPLFADGQVNDVDGSYGIFALVAVLVPVIVFLLSRRPVGLVFLLVADVIACGTVQFLWRDWIAGQGGLEAALLALFGIAMLFVYQCYKQSVYSAKRVKTTAFFGAFGFAAIAGALSVLVGVIVFFGVVNALGLPTPEIKFFENYVARPIDPETGTCNYQSVYGDDTTDQTNDDENQTQDDAESNSIGSAISDALLSSAMAQAIAQSMGYDSTNPNQDYESIGYQILQIMGLIIAVILILLVVAAILLQRYRRTWRLKRLAKRSPEYRVWYLYGFLMERFRRLRIRKPEYLTPLEFALGFRKVMEPFEKDTGGADFIEVSRVYVDVVYGRCKVSDEDWALVERYYRAFFKNARHYVGWPKWILYKYWRI